MVFTKETDNHSDSLKVYIYLFIAYQALWSPSLECFLSRRHLILKIKMIQWCPFRVNVSTNRHFLNFGDFHHISCRFRVKVCLKSSSCASAAEENTHTLYCLPPFLWMSLSILSIFKCFTHQSRHTQYGMCWYWCWGWRGCFSLPLHVCPWLCPSGNAFLTASCQEGPGNQPHEGEPGPPRDAKHTDVHTSRHKQTHTNTYAGTCASTRTHTPAHFKAFASVWDSWRELDVIYSSLFPVVRRQQARGAVNTGRHGHSVRRNPGNNKWSPHIRARTTCGMPAQTFPHMQACCPDSRHTVTSFQGLKQDKRKRQRQTRFQRCNWHM